jgi:hypothetical protein
MGRTKEMARPSWKPSAGELELDSAMGRGGAREHHGREKSELGAGGSSESWRWPERADQAEQALGTRAHREMSRAELKHHYAQGRATA